MEVPWFVVFVTLCFCFALKAFFHLIQHVLIKKKPNLPPGPPVIPILTNLHWLLLAFSDLESTLRQLSSKYGPIISVQIGNRKSIFIATHDLAHKALIQNGAAFADRPPPDEIARIVTNNQHTVNSAGYGPLWRLLRRNLSSEILHPSRFRLYSNARKWVLQILKNKLEAESESGQQPVRVIIHFQYAMFCLLVVMCFGEKMDEKVIRQIEKAQRDMIVRFNRFNVLNFFPKLGKVLLRHRWSEFWKFRSNQQSVLLPPNRARVGKKNSQQQVQMNKEEESVMVAYVDTLTDLSLPDEGGRKLNEKEIMGLCSELLNGGTDTTATALQWIMANLVRHQDIQKKLYNEIKETISGTEGTDEIKEEDLMKMQYLKAVVLEGLRRHPPAHFVTPHAITEDVVLGDHVVPKGASVNFMVAEMGWDPKVWEDPMEFKPERFLNSNNKGAEGFDITGSREIRMMPFGAGRRICPGLELAMLHLEYFVANLVMEFEWKAKDGDEVDLSEKLEFTNVMKYQLWAHLTPRAHV